MGGAIACATPYIERHDGGLPLQAHACSCGRLGAPCAQAAPYLEQARLRDDERARLGVRNVARFDRGYDRRDLREVRVRAATTTSLNAGRDIMACPANKSDRRECERTRRAAATPVHLSRPETPTPRRGQRDLLAAGK